MKILQMPNLVTILYEYHTIFRQIFMDGRAPGAERGGVAGRRGAAGRPQGPRDKAWRI
jgi:hypothetical protein